MPGTPQTDAAIGRTEAGWQTQHLFDGASPHLHLSPNRRTTGM